VQDDDAVIGQALRILDQRMRARGQPIGSMGDLTRHAALLLANERTEILMAYWLDAGNRVIDVDRVAEGGLLSAGFSPREIARKAVLNDAAAVVLVHNHPSGDPDPSKEDERASDRVAHVLATVGIFLAGSFVVAGTEVRCAMTGRRYALGLEDTHPKSGVSLSLL
jgi:DNA repair protein RadC